MSEPKYDFVVDEVDQSTSHAVMVGLVGSAKRVLDIGCATGYLAKRLGELGNSVAGVEGDADAAEAARRYANPVVVGDLEDPQIFAGFGEATFDVLLFGDVLEHLRDPLATLRRARPLLRPGGFVVVSVPNVSHGDVRLSLLKGRFDYQRLGLLDDTHLRFFTRKSLREMLRAAGFVAVDVRNTTVPLFQTELGVTPDEFPPDLIEWVSREPDVTTYQFVFRAVLDDAVAASEDTAWRLKDLQVELQSAREDRDRLCAAVDASARERETERDAARAAVDEAERERDSALTRATEAEEAFRALESTKVFRATAGARRMFRRLRHLER